MGEVLVLSAPGRRARPSIDVVVSIVLAAGTVVVIAIPAARVSASTITGRVAVELSIVFAMGMAALLLWASEHRAHPTGRDAFVAALATQCLVNLLYGVVPAVWGEPLDLDRTYYPWLVGRFVAGGLLLAAAARLRSGRVHRTLAVALLTAVACQAVIAVAEPAVPRTAGGPAELTGPGTHWLLELPPLGMFGVGAVAAARFAAASGEPLERWLSRALGVGAFTQVHEALFPAALGAVITSADVLRGLSAALLLVGVVLQLKRWQAQRDGAVTLLRGELLDSRAALVEVARARDREAAFVGLMTHELAAPLTALTARTHVLEMLADDTQRPHLEALIVEADRLRSLLGRMDELRSLDNDEFQVVCRPAAIVPLLDEAAVFARGLPERPAVLIDAEPASVLVDPVRLGQVLRNVLLNATRYSPAGSPVRIQGSTSDGAYVVVVADQGPGVAQEDIEALFQPGVRGSSPTAAPGAGVGMHLCRRIMQAHEGRIDFADPELHGTRVRLEMTLA